MTLKPHQQRVVDEKKDLDEKIVNLTAFIYGNKEFAGLSGEEQGMLQAQLEVMKAYSDILFDRIENFDFEEVA